MRALVITLLLLPLGLAWSEPAEVTIGIPKVMPWADVADDNAPYGALVEIVQKMDQRTEERLVPKVRPYNRVLLELQQGDVDFAMVFEFPGAEDVAEKVFDMLTLNTFVVAPGDAQPLDALSDLDGKRVGYIQGAYYGPDFHRHDGFDKVPVRDFAHGLMLMEHDRLAAVVSGEVAIAADYDPEQFEPIRKIYQLEGATGVLYRSRLSRTEAAPERLAAVFAEIQAEGIWEAVMDEWIGQQGAP